MGPKLAQLFAQHDLLTVGDLLTFFPRTYQDRSVVHTVQSLSTLPPESQVTLKGKITGFRHRGRSAEALFSDGTGAVTLKWFRVFRGLEQTLAAPVTWTVVGKPKRFLGRLELNHPELMREGQGVTDSIHAGRLVPVYREISGLSTRLLRKIQWSALEAMRGKFRDGLPESIRTKYAFPDLESAIRSIHFPTDQGPGRAWDRLVYEELLMFFRLVCAQRAEAAQASAEIWRAHEGPSTLPFALTEDQQAALSAIRADFLTGIPMNRLVQGDVGSGKTIVAGLAARDVVLGGGQAVLLAPTEILARQHEASLRRCLGGDFPLRLLAASTKAQERREILADFMAGVPSLTVGTHALLEPDVEWKRLGFVIGDEQHRFGVSQRQRLVRPRDGKTPHALWMSATPIPRTLALTVYGHLSLTQIRQKPAGRKPIRTHRAPPAWQARAMAKVVEELRAGRQAYWVFPAISEVDPEAEIAGPPLRSIEVEGAEVEHQLRASGFVVERLHGALSAEEKREVMLRFTAGSTHVLIATTVVEVGMDVPNATVMVVENAERFGLSQLHQLRGRVGRGAHGSWNFLFCGDRLSETAEQRLATMERTEDGFEIAEADLKLRGPGEYLGLRQSGQWPFKIADPTKDQIWMDRAKADAEAMPVATDWRSS